MKRTLFVALLVTLVGSVAMFSQPNGKSGGDGSGQVFAAMAGGSVWTSSSTGTCIWYFPILGDVPLTSLFESVGGSPVIDKEHSYFIWVSDWSIEAMFQNPGFGGSAVSLARVGPGTATIYYTKDPLSRVWTNLSDRSTWGTPIAKLVRGGGMFQSPDNFATDEFYFSATLLTSKEVNLQGRAFNFRDLMPHGMSCFESGLTSSSTEYVSCLKMGD